MIEPRDEQIIEAQLGRPPRSIHDIGHRCPCGNPDVVATEPKLDDGTPFPTTFYLTCPRASSMIGTLESSGLMAQMSDRISSDPSLATAYERAHEACLVFREAIGHVPDRLPEHQVGLVGALIGSCERRVRGDPVRHLRHQSRRLQGADHRRRPVSYTHLTL